MDTPERVQPVGETEAEERTKEEAERKRRTEIARWKEIELESRGIFLPWNNPEPASDPARDAANSRSIVDAASEPLASQPPDRPIVVADSEKVEAQNTVATSIPLEPAVTDAAVAQRNEPKRAGESHLLRDIALGVLVAAMILAAVQWRSIRDYALPYIRNGMQQVRPQEAQPMTPPAVAAENTSRVSAKEPDVATRRSNGKTGADVPSAQSGTPPAPGSAEMYQAAQATDATLRAAWLWKALRAGNPQAPVELAKMYAEGEGVAQSCDQARTLLSAAADKGNEQAKLSLQQLQLREGCSGQ